jgi:hypothetical protein
VTADIDLDHAAHLSSRCSSGDFAVVTRDLLDDDHPTPCCWIKFGADDPPPYPATTTVNVAVSINGDDYSLRTSEGALADAACVAWLLTHRDELIRLARIGQEHDR